MELDYLDYLEIKGYLAYWLVRHLAKLFSSLCARTDIVVSCRIVCVSRGHNVGPVWLIAKQRRCVNAFMTKYLPCNLVTVTNILRMQHGNLAKLGFLTYSAIMP